MLAAVPSYDWGHVAMYTLWSAIGLGVFTFALRRQAGEICTGSLFWLAVTVVAVFANGESSLAANPRGVAFLVVGGTVLAAAFVEQLLGRRRGLTPVALALALASVGLGVGAITALLGGALGDADEMGLGLLGLALLYAVLSASVFRVEGQRDFATLLWGTALVLGYGSSVRLLPGTYHVLVLSLAAVLLAVLAPRVREPRLMVAAVVCVLVGVATVILGLTPPSHLFRAQASPGHGALGALFVAIAAALVAHLARESELGRRAATVGWWTAGVLVVYGLSLFILELFQVSFAGSVDSNFHRGHTAVSAFWGLIGLALLYIGLTRLRALRVAGFVMFTVALAKIFLFDLPSLSSITRALSFLAVGAVLMLGGFFYQRLATAQPAPAKRRRERFELPRGLGRPELVVALVAAAVLIVWFGSGLAPLGRSSEQASAALAAPVPVTTVPADAPKPARRSRTHEPAVRTYGPFATDSEGDTGSCGNDWANESFSRLFKARTSPNPDGRYSATEYFLKGSFVTVAGPSPGGCGGGSGGRVGAGIKGHMHGSVAIVVSGGKYDPTATCDASMCGATDDFVNTVYGDAATYDASSFEYRYTTAGHGSWTNASADRGGNQGDIATGALARGAEVPVRCELFANEYAHSVGLLVDQCTVAVNRVVVDYPRKVGDATPSVSPANNDTFDCPVLSGRIALQGRPAVHRQR